MHLELVLTGYREGGNGGEVTGRWGGPVACLKGGGGEWVPLSRGGEALVECQVLGGQEAKHEGGGCMHGRLVEVRGGTGSDMAEVEACGQKRRVKLVQGSGTVWVPEEARKGGFSGAVQKGATHMVLAVCLEGEGGEGSVTVPVVADGGGWCGVAQIQLTGGGVAVLKVHAGWWRGRDQGVAGEGGRRKESAAAAGEEFKTARLSITPVDGQGDSKGGGGVESAECDGCMGAGGGEGGGAGDDAPAAGAQAGGTAAKVCVSVLRTYQDPHDRHIVYVCSCSVPVSVPLPHPWCATSHVLALPSRKP